MAKRRKKPVASKKAGNSRKPKKKSIGKRIFAWLWKTAAIFIGISLFSVLLYKWLPVPATPLMVIRSIEQKKEGQPMVWKHQWVPFSEISKNMQLAVVCSEDQNFMKHNGFDLKAIEQAVDASKKKNKRLRGASTISQQTAKNVFLWPHRSWARKGLEVYFTALIEFVWGKKRILEVYLNSIETGNGIYGVEAAAQAYFNKPASKLTANEAATITAILPNPRKYKAVNPGPYVQERVLWITNQMQQWGTLKFGD
jgi:monofunctional glycosyltransferase